MTRPVPCLASLLTCSTAAAALFAALPAQAAPRAILCLDPAAVADEHGHVHHTAPAGRLIRLAQASDAPAATGNEAPPDATQLAAELGDLLQACSYEGDKLTVRADSLVKTPQGEGREVVDQIMKFTGLPPNFEVVEGPVPNAAAMIVVDENDLPLRVIAYNRDFIQEVRTATAGNDWAPISIMAHEIGHHLSGHTLIPGGSQPPIELEADRFSGFVLNKMGASLGDTTRAIDTLIPEADGPTHPGRAKRLAAVTAGWTDSCAQSGKPDCAPPAAAPAASPAVAAAPAEGSSKNPAPVAAPAAPPVAAAPADTAQPGVPPTLPGGDSAARPAPGTVIAADADLMARPQAELEAMLIEVMGKLGDPAADQNALLAQMEALNIALATKNGMTVVQGGADLAQSGPKDVVPVPDPAAIPRKGDRFVYDAMGILNPEGKAQLEQRAFEAARDVGVEVVTIVTDDLHGMTPDTYAATMLRQLRAGKMDVGNGAVVVIAPKTLESGLAVGPGLAIIYGYGGGVDQLRSAASAFVDSLASGADPAAPAITEQVGWAADRILRDADNLDWELRFNNLAAMDKAFAEHQAQLTASGASYDPEKDPVASRLVRVEATVTDRTPQDSALSKFVNPGSEALSGPALLAKTPDGRDLMLYASPLVEHLMTAPLVEGQRYSMVLREETLDITPASFAVVSYDALAD